MSDYVPARLGQLFSIVEMLEVVAREIAREARRRAEARRPRPKRGATLRPGGETPLWNALAAAIRPRLARRGARALLGRELNLHRARIGEYFGRQSAMPDAERTLELLLWLGRQPPASSAALRQERRR